MKPWKAWVCVVLIAAGLLLSIIHPLLISPCWAVTIVLIWWHKCPRCKRRWLWAHPESEKVCRSCAIVKALTNENDGDWNST